jgi:hypothetical protein
VARPLRVRPLRRRWQRCEQTGKRSFATRVDALMDTTVTANTVYRCPFGRHWHTTSQKKHRRQSPRDTRDSNRSNR